MKSVLRSARLDWQLEHATGVYKTVSPRERDAAD